MYHERVLLIKVNMYVMSFAKSLYKTYKSKTIYNLIKISTYISHLQKEIQHLSVHYYSLHLNLLL